MSHSTDIILEPSTTAVTFTGGSSSQVTVTHAITEVTLEEGSTTQLISGVVIDNRLYYDLAFAAAQEYSDVTVSAIVSTLGDKADLVGGLVPAAQLPSFVDDVLDGTYVNTTTFNDEDGNPYTPESNKVYIDTMFNKSYRWSGSLYAPLDEGVVLGETSSTAYRGDRGKISYDHSQSTGNPHGTTFSDLLSQSALFNLVYSAYAIGSNVAIAATDALGEMLGKLQAQINNKEPTIPTGGNTQYIRGNKTLQDFGTSVRAASLSGLSVATSTAITAADSVLIAAGKLQAQINNKEPSITSGSTGEYWSWDKTWRSFATNVLGTVLTGFSTATATAVTASDTTLSAAGKLQAQIDNLTPATFNQSRWIFNDFDSSIGASGVIDGGYLMGSASNGGTRVGVAGGVGTHGVMRVIATATANTGFGVSNATVTAPSLHTRPLQGSCCLFVAALPSSGSSRQLTIGFDATTTWAVISMPTNSVHARFNISSFTVSASCRRSTGGTTTTQGSTVLTGDAYYVFLVQYVADDQVRFVIWNLLTNVKVFDETIVTNTPTTANEAILFHGIHATGINTQPLVDIDYIGRGIGLPPFFAIPP